ncbi:MAG: C39 family peptidase [Sulfurimonas sp.]|jgi:predicted double-glycine peptidase|uniref:C39 family peptidase n=1 Tax=Sulfurimonas sp. TaxID=2022749 RepID=UPI0035637F82
MVSALKKFADIVPDNTLINVKPVDQKFSYDCGPSALAAVLTYHGEDVKASDLYDKSENTRDNGLSFAGMKRAAEAKGYGCAQGAASIGTVKKLLDRGFPVIAGVQDHTSDGTYMDNDDGHYTVVTGYNDEGFVITDSVEPYRKTVPYDTFSKSWKITDDNGGEVRNWVMVVTKKDRKKADIVLDIDKGDTLLGGKFKNSPMEVKEISTDDNGQPTVNDKKLLAVRIAKQMPGNKPVSAFSAMKKADWTDTAKEWGGNVMNFMANSPVKQGILPTEQAMFAPDVAKTLTDEYTDTVPKTNALSRSMLSRLMFIGVGGGLIGTYKNLNNRDKRDRKKKKAEDTAAVMPEPTPEDYMRETVTAYPDTMPFNSHADTAEVPLLDMGTSGYFSMDAGTGEVFFTGIKGKKRNRRKMFNDLKGFLDAVNSAGEAGAERDPEFIHLIPPAVSVMMYGRVNPAKLARSLSRV